MTRPRKSTPEMERLLYVDDADPDAMSDAIDLVVTDQLFDHEPQIRKLVNHREEEIRGQAARSLIGIWAREDLFEKAYHMLRKDPSDIARTQALTGFGVWLQHSAIDHPRRDEVIRQMAAALRDEQDDFMQMVLYRNLREAITGQDYFTPRDFEFERDVDWELIKPYLTASE